MSSLGKKKRVSKKTRASWRKHADITDVEEFLEQQRQDERIGKFDGKLDEELFQIDTNRSLTSSHLSASEKRKRNAQKPARNISALDNTSKVSDPITKRNHLRRNLKNRRGPITENTYLLKPPIPKTLDVSKKLSTIVTNDIWAEEKLGDNLKEYKNDMISKELALHHLKNTGRILVKIPESTHHKTSLVKAFVAPHPGTSYNPSLKDHEALIAAVVQKEEEIIKKEKHLTRVTTDMFSKVTEYQREYDRFKELTSGVPIVQTDQQQIEKQPDEEIIVENKDSYVAINPPVINKKKSRKALKNKVEQREIRQKLQQKKLMKKQVTDIHRLRYIKENVLAEEDDTKNIMKRRKIIARKKKFLPKRLSKNKYAEPDIDVNDVHDIAGNIRNIKTESSLLADRFKDFQKRNILVPCGDDVLGKRGKFKRVIRSSHREPQLPLEKVKKTKQHT